MLKAYKYRLDPNKKQQKLLNITFDCCRFVWNYHVNNFLNHDKYKLEGKIIYKKYNDIRDLDDKDFLENVSARALQNVDLKFKEFEKQFFDKNRKVKLGKPKYKKKYKNDAYTLTNVQASEKNKPVNRFLIKDNKIRIERIGWVKIILNREIPSHYIQKSITIKRNQAGQYYVTILVETNGEPKHVHKTGKTVGIDLGIETFITKSDNTKVENHKFLSKSQAKITKYQQILSNKKKGSNRFYKHCKKLAKLHLKVTNQRNNLIHNVTKQLVTDYDVICTESLNVKSMIENSYYSKSLSDVSFGFFIEVLTYKCIWYSKTLLKVDQYYPSSKTCSNCDHVKKELNINERTYNCKNCGHTMNRDLNAAINIERKALGDQVLNEQPKTV